MTCGVSNIQILVCVRAAQLKRKDSSVVIYLLLKSFGTKRAYCKGRISKFHIHTPTHNKHSARAIDWVRIWLHICCVWLVTLFFNTFIDLKTDLARNFIGTLAIAVPSRVVLLLLMLINPQRASIYVYSIYPTRATIDASIEHSHTFSRIGGMGEVLQSTASSSSSCTYGGLPPLRHPQTSHRARLTPCVDDVDVWIISRPICMAPRASRTDKPTIIVNPLHAHRVKPPYICSCWAAPCRNFAAVVHRNRRVAQCVCVFRSCGARRFLSHPRHIRWTSFETRRIDLICLNHLPSRDSPRHLSTACRIIAFPPSARA